jgi:hypothetical protein
MSECFKFQSDGQDLNKIGKCLFFKSYRTSQTTTINDLKIKKLANYTKHN